jgi:hypothetical protein
MPGALPDILSWDGDSLFMRHARFDREGQSLPPVAPHLYSSVGFLDDSWWHRTYWQVGTNMQTGYGAWPNVGNRRISGRLLVTKDDRVYGFGRKTYNITGSHVGLATDHHLFAADRKLIEPEPEARSSQQGKKAKRPGTQVRYYWSVRLPFYARGMVLAGDTLFVAGPSDVADLSESRPKGAVWLWAISAQDGEKMASYRLKAPPVFDGLVAAKGDLFLTTTDGRVARYAGGRQ